MADEIGRELKVSELEPGTVVIVKPPRHAIAGEAHETPYMTLWVKVVTDERVVFYAGELRTYILNFITPDGAIVDGRGGVVHVYEYLGKI